ncbi:MAG TPA: hypothetical protein VNR86_01030 [Sphingomicrobium sp.]|nr:hypothetical protein [Sphingomicrobium sp.]
MTEPPERDDAETSGRRISWTTVALIGGLALLLLIIVYFATRRNADEDKLTKNQVVAAAPKSREKLCASSDAYELIKRELFRRAAQLRGSDQATYDRLAAYASVRMENAVMESEDPSTGAVNCSGSLSLDLPPGVAVAGGRRTLSSEIDYSVTAAADGSGTVVLLRNADAIITSLATLVGIIETPPSASQQPETANQAPGETSPGALAPQPGPAPPGPPSRPTNAGPSFDCSAPRSRGEAAVCSDAGLSSLDRQLAGQYNRAFTNASSDQRGLLRDTARRFYAYRDNCPTNACIADAYGERMREIRDIMEGRWERPR